MEEKVSPGCYGNDKSSPCVQRTGNRLLVIWEIESKMNKKKKMRGIKETYAGGRGNRRVEILLRPKNILATSKVINKQTKIKKNNIF